MGTARSTRTASNRQEAQWPATNRIGCWAPVLLGAGVVGSVQFPRSRSYASILPMTTPTTSIAAPMATAIASVMPVRASGCVRADARSVDASVRGCGLLFGQRVHDVRCDVRRRDHATTLFRFLGNALPHLDLLVVSAACFRLCQIAVEPLMNCHHGRVVGRAESWQRHFTICHWTIGQRSIACGLAVRRVLASAVVVSFMSVEHHAYFSSSSA